MAERESDQEERDRKDKEKADTIRDRQIRLGHISAETEEPKAKSKAKK